MWTIALTVLALAGGVAATFFIMDAPRRRANDLQRRLREELNEVHQERDENEDRARRLAAQARDLRDADAALVRREREFDRRAIAYEDLATENRLVKADLRNMALVAAQMEHQVGQLGTLSRQREKLGQAYLEEVRAPTRKALTASNYPASKRRIEDALRRLETAGVHPTEAGRQQILSELQHLYELAVRASVEREEQVRIREQIREEQRRERDAQAAVEQAERERRAIEAALNQGLLDAAHVHAAEVDRLRAQLAEAEAKAARASSLAQITKPGYVYVVSNICSVRRVGGQGGRRSRGAAR